MRPALTLLLALLAGWLALPSLAVAAPRRPGVAISDTPSSTRPHWACPEGLCDAIVEPRRAGGDSKKVREGYGPAELRSAYAIPTSGGSGETIALVEGFAYKQAEADLATYRSQFGMRSCTTANGCYHAVGREGQAPTYKAGSGWETEEALDLDMASAACPECNLLLVDAESEAWDPLARAVDTAASMGATLISNSYGLPDETCTAECAEAAPAYDHPGVMIMVASGDYGYDNYLEGASSPSYPAELPDVIAVGGTNLKRGGGARGWTEKAWNEPHLYAGSGSGCTTSPKPSWQHDMGCSGRTDNDVAAVGACATPVAVYNSVEGGWGGVCGTSVASPLVAGIEAHASSFARSLSGAQAFYEDPSALFDITSGSNGKCSGKTTKYLCKAGKGYDGPTGNGTPDGPLELSG